MDKGPWGCKMEGEGKDGGTLWERVWERDPGPCDRQARA